jgi:hypothetical protein
MPPAIFFRNHAHDAEISRADLVEFRVVHTDTRLGQLTIVALSGHKKGSPCPKPPQLDITTALVLPPASLGPTATSPSLPSVPFLTERAVHSLHPQRREEARK